MTRIAEPDLVVVGGGAGGLSAARAGARQGARVMLVHDGPIGGDCTFTGCVPSKTLIECAHRGTTFAEATKTVRETVDAIAATETPDVLRREGVTTLAGHATFRSPTVLEVDGVPLGAARIVLATGARPAIPPIDGLDTVDFLTNETVFALSAQPTSLIVLGGGAIGCELAQAFATFGSKVTIVEGLDHLLPREEHEASDAIADRFTRDGITLRLGRTVRRVSSCSTGVRCELDDGALLDAQALLVAIGRRPNTESLNPERSGVELDEHGFIRTDEHLATTRKGVWAVGDVTGRLQFTHAADAMGRIATANALGRWSRRFNTRSIPWVTFTEPEVAHVGVTEADAPSGSRVAFQPMIAVDRAITAGATEGFVKLIAGPHPLTRNLGGGHILGATVVASRAGELIHEPALAMRAGMFTGRLAQLPHAYPTWSVAIQQAAAQFFIDLDGRCARPARGR